jgi:hypothetical protein
MHNRKSRAINSVGNLNEAVKPGKWLYHFFIVCFTGEVMIKEITMQIYEYYNDSNIHNSFK